MSTELPMVLIKQELMNPKSYSAYSQGITQCPDLWLKFDLQNIKHIIVNETSERRELIEFIIDSEIGDMFEQYELFSKIIVFDELKEDW